MRHPQVLGWQCGPVSVPALPGPAAGVGHTARTVRLLQGAPGHPAQKLDSCWVAQGLGLTKSQGLCSYAHYLFIHSANVYQVIDYGQILCSKHWEARGTGHPGLALPRHRDVGNDLDHQSRCDRVGRCWEGHGGVTRPDVGRAGSLGPGPCLHRTQAKSSSTRQITLELKCMCVVKPDT